jgi:exodeoxyribonuclease VII large subunit
MDNIKAQISGAIWYKEYLFIKNKLGALTQSILSPGTHIQIKVRVDFNERYGMKLLIEDIDPSYTMGRLEMSRQKIIERLKSESVTDLNAKLEIPAVIQNIAIISSEKAAGYKDFLTQCQQNPYGYKFHFTLYQTAMQGQNTEREVCLALDQIESQKNKFDAIVIIRGGGAKLDLAAFDNFNIGYKISQSSIPVITGIGHEIDQSVADLVSAVSLKTPTAVADFLIERCLKFESYIMDTFNRINNSVKRTLKYSELVLNQISQNIMNIPESIINQTSLNLEYIESRIETFKINTFDKQKTKLTHIENTLQAYDPDNVLRKGYTMIRQNSKYISKTKDLAHEELTIMFSDGEIDANPK